MSPNGAPSRLNKLWAPHLVFAYVTRIVSAVERNSCDRRSWKSSWDVQPYSRSHRSDPEMPDPADGSVMTDPDEDHPLDDAQFAMLVDAIADGADVTGTIWNRRPLVPTIATSFNACGSLRVSSRSIASRAAIQSQRTHHLVTLSLIRTAILPHANQTTLAKSG